MNSDLEKHWAIVEARNAVMPFIAEGWRVSAIESIDSIIACAVSKVLEERERGSRSALSQSESPMSFDDANAVVMDHLRWLNENSRASIATAFQWLHYYMGQQATGQVRVLRQALSLAFEELEYDADSGKAHDGSPRIVDQALQVVRTALQPTTTSEVRE
jgi:hypothetical protein